jgi:hypothetical protein
MRDIARRSTLSCTQSGHEVPLRPQRMIRIIPFLLSGVLAGCTTAKPPLASVDVRALCQELTQASASSPELIDKNYFAQCMIEHGANAPAGQKAP